MLKCNIVRDLLPIYIDKLTSKETENELQEHLQKCNECNNIFEQLKVPVENIYFKTGNREINYLKKIKVQNAKKIGIIIGIMLFTFTILCYFFLIGSPVKTSNMKYTTKVVNNQLLIDFKLTNGKALNMKTSYVLNETSKKIEKIILKPYEVIQSPICEGTEFMYGQDDNELKLVIQFADKEVIIPNEILK